MASQSYRLLLLLTGAAVLLSHCAIPVHCQGTVPPTPSTDDYHYLTDDYDYVTPGPIPCEDYLRFSNQVFSVDYNSITGESIFSVEGIVEVCVDGIYYAICDEGWDHKDAQVACTAFDYDPRFYNATPIYGLASVSRTIAENVTCVGNETHASQCGYTSPPVTPRCYTETSAAGVRCTQVRVPCFSEGEIAVVNLIYENYLNFFTGGPVNISGRVGVCHGELQNYFYGTVCDVNWDSNDADVLCKSIGSRNGIPLHGLNEGLESVALEDVNCTGRESQISDCPTSPLGVLSPTCREPNRTAGVICAFKDGDCINSALRLVDGPTFYEGRVEICTNNTWLSVCDIGIPTNTTLADTACERRAHLGGNAVPVFGSVYGPGTGPQLVVCDFDSYSGTPSIVPVENCTSNPDLQRLCSHNHDAGVRCQPGLMSMFIFPTDVPTIGSTSFALQCLALQYPWEAKLHSDSWYIFDAPIAPGGHVLPELLVDSYNPSAFNLSYTYRSDLNFGQPLNVSDRGEYSCNVSIQLTYPDGSSYLLTNSSSYSLNIQVPPPSLSVEINGTRLVGTHLEASCFVELLYTELAAYVTIDIFDGSFTNLSSSLEAFPQERIQLLPTRRYNRTHVVRTIIVDPLSVEDQSTYYCWASFSDPYLQSFPSSLSYFLQVTSNDTGSGTQVPDSFLPFGTAHGDSIVPSFDDGSSEEIIVDTDIVMFGSRHRRLYVNTNGVLSFREPFTRTSSGGLNFNSTPSTYPIIVPFWDDINVFVGGTIYYRQESDPLIVEQLQQNISSQYPEAELFRPSLVFVATWDRVEAFSSNFRGLVNTFQTVVVSNGTQTFVRFVYGDIQWGGLNTLIGVSAGDLVNFITHPASLSSSVLTIDNTTVTYRVDLARVLPECSTDGELIGHFSNVSNGRFEGSFEICVGGFYGSVCDFGWNQAAAQAVCRSQLGNNYAILSEPLIGLGNPPRRYVAQNVYCPPSATSLRNCSYGTYISSTCATAPHVAGVRCTRFSANFIPYGPAHGDSIVPRADDGSSREIILDTDVGIFGSYHSSIYVNTNGVLSLGKLFVVPSSRGSNFSSVFPSPPLIAPFWDNIDVTSGGTIYYRQELDPLVLQQLQRDISSQYPEAELFHPSLAFLATWDRVESYDVDFRGLVNTFQVVIISDGTITFVRFVYGDIQWGGPNTLIGVSAGDRVNFITHPASLSSSVLLLDNTVVTYNVDLFPPPLEVQGLCSVVVWYSPDLTCERIHGYDVRFYDPQATNENVTRQVGSNGTFYIINNEDRLVGRSGETYVQVRVIYIGVTSDWSEGISLGCDKPTLMPTVKPEIPRVYFELKGKIYLNNSAVRLSEVGEGENALFCKTDKKDCCATKPNRFGEFYYPNRVTVPIARLQHHFYRNRGEQSILLNRREGARSPKGTYTCEIPNADDKTVRIYITLTE